jgi:hypothetical protein
MKRRMVAIVLFLFAGVLAAWWPWSLTHREFIAYTRGKSYFVETGRGGMLVFGTGHEGCTPGWSRYPENPSDPGNKFPGNSFITDGPTRWNVLGLGTYSRSKDEMAVGIPFWFLMAVSGGAGIWLLWRRRVAARGAFPVVTGGANRVSAES